MTLYASLYQQGIAAPRLALLIQDTCPDQPSPVQPTASRLRDYKPSPVILQNGHLFVIERDLTSKHLSTVLQVAVLEQATLTSEWVMCALLLLQWRTVGQRCVLTQTLFPLGSSPIDFKGTSQASEASTVPTSTKGAASVAVGSCGPCVSPETVAFFTLSPLLGMRVLVLQTGILRQPFVHDRPTLTVPSEWRTITLMQGGSLCILLGFWVLLMVKN